MRLNLRMKSVGVSAAILMAIAVPCLSQGSSKVSTDDPRSKSLLDPANVAFKTEPKDAGRIIDWGDGKNRVLAFSGSQKDESSGKIQHELNLSNLGIDHWEEGRLVDDLWERWDLKLQDPPISPGLGEKPWCQLERMIFLKGFSNHGVVETGSFINLHNYSTGEGNLQITRLDWKQGVFEFQFGQRWEGDPIKCEIRFDSIDDESIPMAYLTHLRAKVNVTQYGEATVNGQHKKKSVNIEYRPTEYTYFLNVPMKMEGMKSPGQRKWNQLIASLSSQDQIAWIALRARKESFKDPSTQDIIDYLQATDPLIAADIKAGKEPKGGDATRVAQVSYELIRTYILEFFSNSKLSQEGQKTLTSYLLEDLEAGLGNDIKKQVHAQPTVVNLYSRGQLRSF